MKVEIINHGKYVKGDVLDLPESTAKALIANKAVKEAEKNALTVKEVEEAKRLAAKKSKKK